MKPIGLIFILVFFFSCKFSPCGKMIVIKDSTGSYLRHYNKDYPICNKELLDPFFNGESVNAGMVEVGECDNKRIPVGKVRDHETVGEFYKVTQIGKH